MCWCLAYLVSWVRRLEHLQASVLNHKCRSYWTNRWVLIHLVKTVIDKLSLVDCSTCFCLVLNAASKPISIFYKLSFAPVLDANGVRACDSFLLTDIGNWYCGEVANAGDVFWALVTMWAWMMHCFTSGATMWNSLPSELRLIDCRCTFHWRLKSHLFQLAFYSLTLFYKLSNALRQQLMSWSSQSHCRLFHRVGPETEKAHYFVCENGALHIVIIIIMWCIVSRFCWPSQQHLSLG